MEVLTGVTTPIVRGVDRNSHPRLYIGRYEEEEDCIDQHWCTRSALPQRHRGQLPHAQGALADAVAAEEDEVAAVAVGLAVDGHHGRRRQQPDSGDEESDDESEEPSEDESSFEDEEDEMLDNVRERFHNEGAIFGAPPQLR